MIDLETARPALFEKTDGSIWTDPWIQKNMVAAHLDASHDAASRRPRTIDATVSWISRLARPGGAILDLGCGPGLYAERLAARGYRVTGIDFNAASIAHARGVEESRAKEAPATSGSGSSIPPITYIEGDYVKNFPEGKFDAIIMIYCDMGTHSDADRDALFAASLAALNPGGVLVFDVFDESILKAKRVGRTWDYSAGPGFWSASPHLALTETFHYPEARAFCYRHSIVAADGTRSFNVWERYYSRRELAAILTKAGFSRVSVRGRIVKKEDFVGASAFFAVARKR